eukprot:g2868.t1
MGVGTSISRMDLTGCGRGGGPHKWTRIETSCDSGTAMQTYECNACLGTKTVPVLRFGFIQTSCESFPVEIVAREIPLRRLGGSTAPD